MKPLYPAICLILILLCGCTAQQSKNCDLGQDWVGTWTLRYATKASDGEEYPLQKQYGSGIQYGGTLTLHADQTFSRYVGIHTDETARYQGTYTVDGTKITFRYDDGTIATAQYDAEEEQILYIIASQNDGKIYEHYEKEKDASPEQGA